MISLSLFFIHFLLLISGGGILGYPIDRREGGSGIVQAAKTISIPSSSSFSTGMDLMVPELEGVAAANSAGKDVKSKLEEEDGKLMACDILIVNTLDGCMHGIQKSNGHLLWSKMMNTQGGDMSTPSSSSLDLEDSLETEEGGGNVAKVGSGMIKVQHHFSTPSSPPLVEDGTTKSLKEGNGDDVLPSTLPSKAPQSEKSLQLSSINIITSPPPPSIGGGALNGGIGGHEGGGHKGNGIIFIPEPAGNGDLYYVEGGSDIKKFPFSLKSIFETSVGYRHESRIYTGSKSTTVLALDPLTGDILRAFGSPSPLNKDPASQKTCEESTKDAVFLGRTEYTLDIYDVKSQRLLWNISFVEFLPASTFLVEGEGTLANGGGLGMDEGSGVSVKADVRGNFRVNVDHESQVSQTFNAPVLNIFDVISDENGNHLHVPRHLAPSPSSPTGRDDNVGSDIAADNVYVGSFEKTFYLLSSRHFPFMTLQDDTLTSPSPSQHHRHHSEDEEDCKVGMSSYPKCLVGSYHIKQNLVPGQDQQTQTQQPLLLEGIVDSSGNRLVVLLMIVLFMLGGVVKVWKRRARLAQLLERFGTRVVLRGEGSDGGLEGEELLAALGGRGERGHGRKRRHHQHGGGKIKGRVGSGRDEKESLSSEEVSSEEAMPLIKKSEKGGKVDAATGTTSNEKSTGEEEAKVCFEEPASTQSRTSETSRPSTNNSGLKNLEVTEKVLGYGSHGTVVLEGSFEGRKVAIKRMLQDFYDVADHEVKMLQESDVHPNVVRYYFKENCDGFMYIALECCAGSIADLVSKKDIQEMHSVRANISHKQLFKQIISGIAHLHSLNIVHRDIKPQNILVSQVTGSKQTPRMLISDFGLGKRLADGQSSFHNTFVPGGGVAGTVGWRAPECLLAHHAALSASDTSSETAATSSTTAAGWSDRNGVSVDMSKKSMQTRITKAIDIFSAGCVFYYVFSDGNHPFGERFTREVNILKGNFRLQHFDGKESEGLLKDLIKRMISKDPSKRPTAEAILRHPYFWTTSQQLSFLQDLSDRLEIECREPASPMLKSLERHSNKVIGRDWLTKVDRTVLDSMSKFRKYDGSSVQDLLRALRNKKHHYQDLPESAKKELGSLPDGFLNYFTSRFPNLLVSMVSFVEATPEIHNDSLFTQYFTVSS